MGAARRKKEAVAGAVRLSKAERKKQLVGAAKQLFVEIGYANTTTAQIAAAAGVSELVLHRHFESKGAFFRDLLLDIRALTLGLWTESTAALTDPLVKLHAVAELYVAATHKHPVEFRILHRTLVASEDAAVLGQIRAFYLECEAFFAGIIVEGQQTGVFRRSLDPRVGAWELIRTALGYAVTLPLDVPLYAEENYLPRAIECVLQCLVKTDV